MCVSEWISGVNWLGLVSAVGALASAYAALTLNHNDKERDRIALEFQKRADEREELRDAERRNDRLRLHFQSRLYIASLYPEALLIEVKMLIFEYPGRQSLILEAYDEVFLSYEQHRTAVQAPVEPGKLRKMLEELDKKNET